MKLPPETRHALSLQEQHANEAQARPLTQLEIPEAQQEAWEMGTKNRPKAVWVGELGLG